MATADQRLNEWLRDAHAMEQQAEVLLQSQAERIEHYPELSARIESHLDETRRQAERLNRCLERRGAARSAFKDAAARMTAAAQGLSGLFVDDEIVKRTLASYTFEQMEIASYKILMAGAEQVGDMETRQVCEQNLREEEKMAAWLDAHLGPTTNQYLDRVDADVAASR